MRTDRAMCERQRMSAKGAGCYSFDTTSFSDIDATVAATMMAATAASPKA